MTKKTYHANITSLSHDGRGIAHINGKIIFLEGGLPGEEVEFIYNRKRSQYDAGIVTEVLKPAANRVTPKCPHFGICGGCSLQYMPHQTQLELKQRAVLEQLKHFGDLTPETLLAPITGPIWGYRRKARLGVKYVIKKAKVLVGFREKNGRYLADIENCYILHATIGMQLTELGTLIACLDNYQYIPQIEVAIGDNNTALIFRHLQPLSDNDLTKLTDFAKQYNFYIYLQLKGPQSIHLLYPQQAPQPLIYNLPKHNIALLFQPTDFTQINTDINKQMVDRAIELIDPQANEIILDLFCGLGNFTLPLARYCKQIIGVEGDVEMVHRATQNALHNNITNSAFYAANLAAESLTEVWTQQKFAKILLDPPRTGALEIIKYISNFEAKKIVYISCNPATLARDAGALVKQGYKLTRAGIIDMFPHTSHVETIALFER